LVSAEASISLKFLRTSSNLLSTPATLIASSNSLRLI
jgi:hypothetical protein